MIHVERWWGIVEIKCHNKWTTRLNRDKIIRWWLLTALYWLVDLVMGPLYSDWYYILCTRLITATATFTIFLKLTYSCFYDRSKLDKTTNSFTFFFAIMNNGFNLKRASFWVDRWKRQIRNCVLGFAVICDSKTSF